MSFLIWQAVKAIPQKILLLLISVYRYIISPLLGSNCRFQPSCSEYARQAITQYGSLRGFFLTIRRLARCHPWGGQGYDPIPKRSSERAKQTDLTYK